MARPAVGLEGEIRSFETVADAVARGDLEIRRRFARDIITLFVATNVFVMIGLGIAFWQDCVLLTSGRIRPSERIIDGKVVMSLLGATTVQLGAVIFTIARAIFPAPAERHVQD